MSSQSLIIAVFGPIFFTEAAFIIFVVVIIGIIIMLLMRPQRFYFVRHGETLMNAAHIKQGAEGGLTESGKRQAALVGEILAPLRISAIISSPYERARETTAIINERLHAPITYSPLLVERRNASAVIGKRQNDPEVAHIVELIDLVYHEDDYRYADEENFQDLKNRARECLSYLARQGSPRTCIVTHHIFLKMLLSYMLFREELHNPAYVKLSFLNTSNNGGISICEYHPWRMFSRTRGWEVVSFNENAGM